MLKKRIICCLDVKDGVVVKGVRFRQHQVVGDILPLAGRYRDEGADELVFYDITASAEGRVVAREWVERTARLLDIPFAVAGGIRSVDDARRVLNSGADKISVNSPALERPELVDELARELRIAVRRHRRRLPAGGGLIPRLPVHGGRSEEPPGRAARARLGEGGRVARGGEIVLNCMGSDGVRAGYDVEQLQEIKARVSVPVIASGGAGSIDHFEEVFRRADVDGALAAGVFHRGEVAIPDLKRRLLAAGIAVRPVEAQS